MKTKLIAVIFLVLTNCGLISAQVNLTQNLKMYLPFTGNAADASGNTNVVAVNGPTLTTDRFGTANAAYHFDGINDYMTITLGQGMKPTYPFTFSCWIKILSSNTQTSVNFVFCNDYTIPGTNYYGAIFNVPVTGIFQANVGDGGPTNSSHRRTKTTNQTVPFNSWHHIAGVVNSATNMRLYIDCAEVPGTYSGSGSGLVYGTGQGNIGRGNGGGGENYLNADLDEMRFYDRALNPAEIAALYYFPNQPTPLTVNLGPDTTICQGSSIQLSAGNQGSTYLWSTGATSQTINVSTPGTYWVSAYNAATCSAGTDTVVVSVVNATPLSLDLGPNTSRCTNLGPLTLDAGNPGATYLWNNGQQTQTIQVNSSGTYSVTVSTACSTATDAITITMLTLPAINVNLGNDTTICGGTPLTLNAGNPGSTYLWSTNQTNQTISITNAGTYWVQVSNACYTDRDTIVVSASQDLPITIDLGNDSTYCQTSQITLTAGPAGNNYLWNTGAITPSINVNQSGTYFVVGQNTCNMDMDTVTVQFAVGQPVNVNLGSDTTVCPNAPQIVLNAANPGNTYLWNDNTTAQTLVVTAPGLYFVTVSNACYTDSDSITVNILNVQPVISSLGPDIDSCVVNPGSFVLDASNPNATQYLWNNNATTPTITVSNGTYSVTISNACYSDVDSITVNLNQLPFVSLGADTTLCNGSSFQLSSTNPLLNNLWSDGSNGSTITVTSAGDYWVVVTDVVSGCINADTISVVANDTPVVTLGADTTVCATSVTILPIQVLNADEVEWNTGDTTQTLTVTQSGLYWLQATNECGISGDSIFVTIIPSLDSLLMLPNVFTPNGDGFNEIFGMPGFDFITAHLTIYNRWGRIVFETGNISTGWDGGENTEGVYYYILTYTDCNTKPSDKKGTITLLKGQ